MQKSDADIEQIYRWKQEGKLPPGDILTAASMEVRHYALCWDALEMKSGILCRKFDKQNGTGSFSQMIVPRSLRNDVLHQMHNSLLSGHLGQKKTKEKILQKYYWFKIRGYKSMDCAMRKLWGEQNTISKPESTPRTHNEWSDTRQAMYGSIRPVSYDTEEK